MRARPDGDIGSLDIRALRTFVEVSEVGHFARAAKNLGMSPSALSRSIRSLEDWSGVALLVRTSRSADLTPAGQSLLPLAQAILGNLREFRDAAKLAEAGRRGVLDIGFMDVVIADFLPGAIARHRHANPDIDLRLHYGWKEQQRSALIEGRLDVAFTLGQLADRELISHRHKRYRLMAVLPDRHPLAGREVLALRELAEQPFVFGIKSEWQSLRDLVDTLCAKAGFRPLVTEEAPGRDALLGFVAAGLGLTIYPQIDALLLRPGIAAVPLDYADAAFDVYLSHRRNPSPLVAGFVAELSSG